MLLHNLKVGLLAGLCLLIPAVSTSAPDVDVQTDSTDRTQQELRGAGDAVRTVRRQREKADQVMESISR